jgi:hypothetical protein
MKTISGIALALALAPPLAGCAAVPAGQIEGRLARIERGIDLASALAEAAASAGALKPDLAARIRSAVATARIALALARDAAAAGQRARAEALAGEAEARLGEAAAALPVPAAVPGSGS